MYFERDFESLKTALFEAECRIKKLEERKQIINKLLRDSETDEDWMDETASRLERNLRRLRKKRDLIFKELES